MRNGNLGAEFVIAGAKGDIPLDAAIAALQVLGGAPMLREVPNEQAGPNNPLEIRPIFSTLDADGNTLAAGSTYQLDGKTILVLCEEFGGGNIMDTHFKVHYLEPDFKRRFLVVDGRHINGLFAAPQYKSRLKPIKA